MKRIIRRSAPVFLVGLVLATSGCFYPAYQGFQSPVTVSPFEFELGPNVGATVGYVVGSTDYGGYDPGLRTTDLVGVDFGFLARFGLLPRFDVGLRLSPGLLGMADLKYRFLSRPLNAAFSLGWSFYPRTGQLYSTSYTGGMAFYPVLAVGGDALFGGLRAVVLHEVNDNPGQWRFQPGAYVAGSFGHRVKIEPELGLFLVDQPGPFHVGSRQLAAVGAGKRNLFVRARGFREIGWQCLRSNAGSAERASISKGPHL